MRLFTVFLLMVTVVTFIVFGIFYQSPYAIERALAFGSAITGLISFAYTIYRGLVNIISNHVARWADQVVVKPIATLIVMTNEDIKRKSIQEIVMDLQRSREVTDLILKSIRST